MKGLSIFGLVKEVEPADLTLDEKKAFAGLSFGKEVPIDLVALFLAGLGTEGYSLLLVDEFLRFNGLPEEKIIRDLDRTQNSLDRLESLYNFNPDVMACSEFMGTEEYGKVLEEMKKTVEDRGLEDELLKTVPERYRESENALEYPLNEIACVEFLRENEGMNLKIGPEKEKMYDEIMQKLGLDIDFAYILDAYALGTRGSEPEEVIHYVPGHRGSGQRLFLDDSIRKAKAKLMLGPEEASRYLLKLASVSGRRLGKDYLNNEEIENLYGIKLKKRTRDFVLENILKPYKDVGINEC